MGQLGGILNVVTSLMNNFNGILTAIMNMGMPS